MFPQSFLEGGFDSDFDGTNDEEHPDWANKLDWLGLQYYFRAGVTGKVQLLPAINGMICLQGFEEPSAGSCLNIPMRPNGSHQWGMSSTNLVLVVFSKNTPTPTWHPLVTESGIATEVGERREHCSFTGQIAEAQLKVLTSGVLPLESDRQFEWAEGYNLALVCTMSIA